MQPLTLDAPWVSLGEFHPVALGQEFFQHRLETGFQLGTLGQAREKLLGGLVRGLETETLLKVDANDLRKSGAEPLGLIHPSPGLRQPSPSPSGGGLAELGLLPGTTSQGPPNPTQHGQNDQGQQQPMNPRGRRGDVNRPTDILDSTNSGYGRLSPVRRTWQNRLRCPVGDGRPSRQRAHPEQEYRCPQQPHRRLRFCRPSKKATNWLM